MNSGSQPNSDEVTPQSKQSDAVTASQQQPEFPPAAASDTAATNGSENGLAESPDPATHGRSVIAQNADATSLTASSTAAATSPPRNSGDLGGGVVGDTRDQLQSHLADPDWRIAHASLGLGLGLASFCQFYSHPLAPTAIAGGGDSRVGDRRLWPGTSYRHQPGDRHLGVDPPLGHFGGFWRFF